MFLASNRKIIENRIKKKNLEQIFLNFPKFYSFLFYSISIHPIKVKRCAHYQTTGTESFILIASKPQILGS